jgi:heme/copper-type cytochrome/quinol oxidase subunit 1
LTFVPQHFLGLNGIPRRYSDYPDRFLFWNTYSSFGSFLSLLSIFLFVFIFWERFSRNRKVLSSNQTSVSLEWNPNYPPSTHRNASRPLVFVK